MSGPEQIFEDGLVIPEVGQWASQKYRFIETYLEIFTSGMRKKWDSLVYVDLYAGAGFARRRVHGDLVMASPLLALSRDVAFDLCVFADADEEKLQALADRAGKLFPERHCEFVPGDCNSNTQAILQRIPESRPGSGVLTICLVDPYKIRDFVFDTVRTLAKRRLDFLVVIPSYMDANRNLETYIQEGDDSIAYFTGSFDWRTRWRDRGDSRGSFADFVAREYATSMESLGYLSTEMEDVKVIRSSEKNLPLYHLSFFSKHETGLKFWREALKYGDDQLDLFRR